MCLIIRVNRETVHVWLYLLTVYMLNTGGVVNANCSCLVVCFHSMTGLRVSVC